MHSSIPGTAFAVPRPLAALEALGLPRSAVDWVIATRVHLDHAGGIGQLIHHDAALNAAGLVAWLDRPSRTV